MNSRGGGEIDLSKMYKHVGLDRAWGGVESTEKNSRGGRAGALKEKIVTGAAAASRRAAETGHNGSCHSQCILPATKKTTD